MSHGSAKNCRHADEVAARQSTSIPTALDSELPDRPQARPRGGRRSRNKGIKAERALVRVLQDNGFAAEGIRLSSDHFRVRELYALLNAFNFLVLKADRREPLVVLPLRLAAEIAVVAERKRGPS
jgi:hypothetical protein